MKIKHYASSWPSSLKIPFTIQEKKFFRFLELNQDFEKQINDIRKKYMIPLNGFSYLKENEIGLGIPKYLDFNKWDQYLEDESIIADAFGFVGTWGLSLTYFIKYNYMPKFAEIVEPRAAIFDGETTLMSLNNAYPSSLKRQVLISLRQKLSKEELKRLIDLQWDQISKEMEKLPAWDKKKHTRINIFSDILKLKEHKKMSWGIIAQLLGNKYGDEKFYDETYLRVLYNRYKKRLKNKPKSSVSLPQSSK